MNQNYLLPDALARRLYGQYVRELPLIDYHNHLSPEMIAQNRPLGGIADLWVKSDPYKHRAMRILGVEERCITGDADDYDKFAAWYESLPRLIGNPLFDWSVMELSTVFDVDLLPFTDTLSAWQKLEPMARERNAGDLLKCFDVEYAAPCAAFDADLSVFADTPGLAPSLRGDDLPLPTAALCEKLGKLTGMPIRTLEDYLAAFDRRLSSFYEVGCRFSDHALDNGFRWEPDDGRNGERFAAIVSGRTLDAQDALCLSSCILTRLAAAYARHHMTMQLHIGAQRKTSTRLRTLAGSAGGYAAMGETAHIRSLVDFLDAVEQTPEGLPQIILFTLNPADNEAMATLCGSFSKDGVEALVTQGPAWWWCDHARGMRDMLDSFAGHSVLSSFVGMTTDSRSLLSLVRHDYFRRVLCQWMAEEVQADRLPEDEVLLRDALQRMCYTNAKRRLRG